MAGSGPGRAFIGTSGWNYPEWRDGFFKGVPQRRWLPHCAERFSALEVNATFYRQMRETAYQRWHRDTPEAFRFCIKGHRYVTHVKRLNGIEDSVRRQRDQARPLASKLACVLWQFPANFRAAPDRLPPFLDALSNWPDVRHAVEFRHTSWFNNDVAGALASANVAHVLSDAPDWPIWDAGGDVIHSDFVYVRLHGHSVTYRSSYQRRTLTRWAERATGWLEDGRDVYLFFDNTMTDAAAKNVQTMISLLRPYVV